MGMWHESGHTADVTCIARSPAAVDAFAVGYADGSIRIWDAPSQSVAVVLNGHRKAVTALAFDAQGTRLASGSQDTDLIVWDVVAEAGLFRFVWFLGSAGFGVWGSYIVLSLNILCLIAQFYVALFVSVLH